MKSSYMSPKKQQKKVLAYILAQPNPVDRLDIARALGYKTSRAVHRSLHSLVNKGDVQQFEFTRPNGTIKHYYFRPPDVVGVAIVVTVDDDSGSG